ncbi:hypothetical protein MLD38_011364 [Melastoma candidum]|uniref:Uncharacterized protein n=1 Tax=Melastoma candidum TaxID=119954 RepID=A0ACB9R2U5_9MYRT|nr:hypothetical protein MLD38_011364 [Melastoma candidum]
MEDGAAAAEEQVPQQPYTEEEGRRSAEALQWCESQGLQHASRLAGRGVPAFPGDPRLYARQEARQQEARPYAQEGCLPPLRAPNFDYPGEGEIKINNRDQIPEVEGYLRILLPLSTWYMPNPAMSPIVCDVDKLGKRNIEEPGQEFDCSYGPAWHCTVGTSFGSYIMHSLGGFLYFSIDKVYILLFRTAVEPLDH